MCVKEGHRGNARVVILAFSTKRCIYRGPLGSSKGVAAGDLPRDSHGWDSHDSNITWNFFLVYHNLAPSKMASPFRRKDIAKALFDLDISDTEPSSFDKKLMRPRRNPSCHPSITITSRAEQELTLLALPAELRLRIYELLLVSWFDPAQNPSWAVGKTCQKKVSLHMIRAPQYRTMEPAILQTCKQIYQEAISILYSRNVFYVTSPEEMFSLMAQIGPTNVKYIRSLEIWVPYRSEILPWLRLLNTLSGKATGLRFLEIAWGAECTFPWQLVRGAEERGLGDNILFVRALARIQRLEKLKTGGFYAKHWPSYLRQEMAVQLHAECGHPLKYYEPEDENEDEYETWVHERNEKNLQSFEAYQKGTEDLMP